MSDTSPAYGPIPDDDPHRHLTVARPDEDANLTHLSLAGDTYTVLVTGEDTAGRYTLIDMLIPPGGGPPPHRHDFEEMFSVLDGELEVSFRGDKLTAKAGQTVNVPANAPHGFHNQSAATVHLLCMCAPSGQEEFFMAVAQPVESRRSAPPELDAAALQAQRAKAARAGPQVPHRSHAALSIRERSAASRDRGRAR